ncbi:MAG: DEAD/DEAH box helicase [Romboutsia timonensis]|uniref:DEAD/DEAH box helicase n=1 Tax=Romboutsia timonensis TaxID=1776391 RepID=UPI002A75D198|nr:DEAD/DEAH box helicase [Romboutsia timonensis]MDY2882562.1 DEAD/DEAH box helicase [Romboutsia timonensis]
MFELIDKSDKFYNIVCKEAQNFNIINNILAKFPDRHRMVDNSYFEFYKSRVNIDYLKNNLDIYLYQNDIYKEIFIKDFEVNEVDDFVLKVKDYQYKTQPWKHQDFVFKKTAKKKKFALFMEPRIGKSKIVLDTASYLFQNKKIDTLLIVAPNVVHRDWIKEAASEHLSCDYQGIIWNPKKKTSTLEIEVLFNNENKLNIFTINKEAIITEDGMDCLNYIVKNYKTMLVIDESHHFKNPFGKRTGFIKVLAMKCPYVRILTGTPIGNKLEDLYSQFEIMDKNILGYSSYSQFSKFCEDNLDKAKEFVYNAIKNNFIRMTLNECFDDLPKVAEINNKFQMTNEQKDIYNQIKDNNFVFNLEDVTLFKNVIIKLQQVTSGFYFDTENNVHKIFSSFKNNPKIKLLEEQLEITNGKVLIWTKFKQEVEDIIEFLNTTNYRYVVYTGDQNQEEKEFAKKMFKENNDIKIMVINISAGAEGLTLNQANTAIFYSSTFSYLQDSQARQRIIKGNDTNKKTIIRLCSIGTIDIRILYLLNRKRNLSSDIIDRDYTIDDYKFILEDESDERTDNF